MKVNIPLGKYDYKVLKFLRNSNFIKNTHKKGKSIITRKVFLIKSKVTVSNVCKLSTGDPTFSTILYVCIKTRVGHQLALKMLEPGPYIPMFIIIYIFFVYIWLMFKHGVQIKGINYFNIIHVNGIYEGHSISSASSPVTLLILMSVLWNFSWFIGLNIGFTCLVNYNRYLFYFCADLV